jgi:hypothetical protein
MLWPIGPTAYDVCGGLRLGLAGFALAQTITFAVHLKDVHVVGQAVQQRTGQSLRAEGFGPFIERQVAGDQAGQTSHDCAGHVHGHSS